MNERTHRFTKGLYLLVITALLAGLALAVAPVAQAATFDIADGDVAGLIAAINTANGNGQPDTINLAAGGTYTLTTEDNDEPLGDGPNGLPPVTSQITINGNGATIQRNPSFDCPVDDGSSDFRIFHVTDSGALTLNDLTVSNGCPYT